MNHAAREYGFSELDPPDPPRFAWYPAQSADQDHPDVELDLAGMNLAGDPQWAWVADEGDDGPYRWVIYSRWLWDDIDADPDAATLAEGTAPTLAEGKLAVEAWVLTHREQS